MAEPGESIIEAMAHLRRTFETAGLHPPVAVVVRPGELRWIEAMLQASVPSLLPLKPGGPGVTIADGVPILEGGRDHWKAFLETLSQIP